jgi:hypothetical protein
VKKKILSFGKNVLPPLERGVGDSNAAGMGSSKKTLGTGDVATSFSGRYYYSFLSS